MNETLEESLDILSSDPSFPIRKIDNIVNIVPYRNENIVQSYSIINKIIIDIYQDFCNVIIPLTAIPISGITWWKFSYSVERILEKYPDKTQRMNYGLKITDCSPDIFSELLLYLFFPEGNNYNSFKETLNITKFLKWNPVISSYAAIPILTDPHAWGVELITPVGEVFFGENETKYLPSLYERDTSKLLVFPQGLKHIDNEYFQKISRNRKMWSEGDKIYSLCSSDYGSLSYNSIKRTFKDLICWKNPGSLPWKTKPAENKKDTIKKTVENGYIIFPNDYGNKEFQIDYGLVENMGRGAAI